MVMKLAQKLKDDCTVKPKKKELMKKLFRYMKDGRILLNLIATVNVLELISKYQKWGQREKASAFERKMAIRKLRQKMKSLTSDEKVKKLMGEEFGFINFKTGFAKIGDLNEKISHLAGMTERKIVARIVKRQTEMGTEFLKIKMQIHVNEDPKFLSDLSNIFDIRLWKMTEFESDHFEGVLEAMKDKMKKEDAKQLYEDLS